MKKTVTVTIEKQIEIEIPDHLLTPEYIEEFSSYMWSVEGPNDLIAYVARKVSEYDDLPIEGMGQPGPFHARGNAEILYSVLHEYHEVEIDGETYVD